MAISTEASILAILKVWYKDGVENLLFRNDPLLKEIKKERVEGKTQNFAALYGRGGAVAADFLVARDKAARTSRNAEFTNVPGDLFSVYNMNAKEVQASLSKRGAYMKVAGNKLFAATEAFRKTLAASMYGSGYGEIGILGDAAAFTANTPIDLELKDDAIIKIDIDSSLVFKATIEDTTILATAVVNSINGNTVNVTPDTTVASVPAGTIVCLAGSMDAAGNAKLPVGFGGWLPVRGHRKGSDWQNYITKSFMGVNRSVAPDRLAGSFVEGDGTQKKYEVVQDLLRQVRRLGSQADFIVMNDKDWLALSREIETTNTYFTETNSSSKKKASVGYAELTAAFSTSWVDNIYDSPYCPENIFYILDKSAVEFWSYTNTEKVNDGISGNNPGKQDVEAMEGAANEGKPYGLIIDDYLTVQSGTPTSDGPSVEVTINLFGSFVVTNPSLCGVGIFDNTKDTLGV